MAYVVLLLLGIVCGGISVFVVLQDRRRGLQQMGAEQDLRLAEIRESLAALETTRDEIRKQQARFVSYKEMQDENSTLKRDILGVEVHLRKLKLDHEVQLQRQEALDQRGQELGSRYLKESVKWISSSLRPDNFTICKQRLIDVITRCRGIGLDIPAKEEESLIADLKAEFERVVRSALEREEQARIKAQIREEQLREREIQSELDKAARERAVVQAALNKALAETADLHSAEIEQLKARLAEAEARSQRAISQAQLTKSGHVYVISNIGSFGERVFKIGMTRRLEPLERIRELGDASVPFPFDIHMMISCDDAPTLENALHRKLRKHQINRVNPRKEFFQTDFETIRQIVEEHHGKVDYTVDAAALQYRQSLSMPADDQEYIEHVFDELDPDEMATVGDD